jgi:prolipoprotein diacylglyceryl transferase
VTTSIPGVGMLTSLPSPSSGVLEIGPLSIHAYGLMIALGVVVGVWLTGRRLEARGTGTRDDASAMAVWAVIAGILGARLYHVMTDWSSFEGDPVRIFQIWKGGLGIPGGLLAGIVVGWWVTKRRGIDPREMAVAAAPAIPLAQSIGRWGNWFNQELFGGATKLPWGLEISDDKIPAGYAPGTLFHPTFLYESLWNLALCGVLILIDRKFRPRAPRLMAMYLAGYGIGRFWVEGLRIDDADEFGPLRFNQWVALVVTILAALYLVWSARRPGRDQTQTSDQHDQHDTTAIDDPLDDRLDDDPGVGDAAVSVSDDADGHDYVAADERLDES